MTEQAQQQNPQEVEHLVAGPVTPELAMHMREKGLTSIERDAILMSLGAKLTEPTVALVASVGPDNQVKAEHYVDLNEEAMGEEIFPDDAAARGLEPPDKALEGVRRVSYPNDDIQPIGIHEVGQAFIENMGTIKH
jgi:hypothetical protein